MRPWLRRPLQVSCSASSELLLPFGSLGRFPRAGSGCQGLGALGRSFVEIYPSGSHRWADGQTLYLIPSSGRNKALCPQLAGSGCTHAIFQGGCLMGLPGAPSCPPGQVLGSGLCVLQGFPVSTAYRLMRAEPGVGSPVAFHHEGPHRSGGDCPQAAWL